MNYAERLTRTACLVLLGSLVSADALGQRFEGLGIATHPSRSFFNPYDSSIDDAGGALVAYVSDGSQIRETYVWRQGQPLEVTTFALHADAPSYFSVSGDGETLLGATPSGGFVLLDANGVESIPQPPFTDSYNLFNSYRGKLGGNGRSFVVIGQGIPAFDSSAFWNGSNWISLPFRPEFANEPFRSVGATAISRDGRIIVGFSGCDGLSCTDSSLPTAVLPTIWNVSEDGSTITSQTYGEDFDRLGFGARAVSNSGVVVGDYSESVLNGLDQRYWFRVRPDGVVELEEVLFPGEPAIVGSSPNDVSADGTVLVGAAAFELGNDADFARRPIMRRGGEWVLIDDLVGASPTLATQAEGWILEDARFVSADGKVIFGTGRDPDGALALWRLDLAIVPEPSTLILVGAASAWLLTFRRQRM